MATRRDFIVKTSIAGAGIASGISAKSYSRIIGSNERVNCAIMGCNRRFKGLVGPFTSLKNAHVLYVGDVDAKRQAEGVKKTEELSGSKPKTEYRIKVLLEDKDLDAVVLATPDHWHGPGTWMALQAGKHVFVEKPASHNPHEGEIMVAMQKKYNKIVQMGNQQRSSAETTEMIKDIHDGAIGETYHAVAFYSNRRGRVPMANKVPVPDYLDWNEFQGPAPRADYLDILGDYMWHWFWNWGTAETGNNATHELDIARWALDEVHPNKVSVHAGKFHYKDDPWTMYDTMDATFYYDDGKTISWDGKSRNGYNTYGKGRGTIIYGSEGTVFVDRNGFQMYDREGKLMKESAADTAEDGVALGGGGGLTARHVRNFVNSIRGTEELNAPIEGGAISTNLCHYANISYRAGNKSFDIDSETGRIMDPNIMQRYWSREYEPGWEPPAID